MHRLRISLSMALLALWTGVAAAQNGSTAGALELYPTLENVGVRLAYTGDANANATARLEWRLTGAPAWTAGMNLTRITSSRWAGSVLWLQADTPYEVRAIIEDPDGGATATGSIRTRATLPSGPTGTTYYVATNGSDSNNGSSGAPFATIQTALNAAQPGDGVRVRAGIYYQTFDTPRSGTAAAPIHLLADAGAVLDGGDPAFLNRSDWRNDGGGVWSVPFTGTTRLVAVDSTMRLYKQTSLANLNANANAMTQGWAAEGGRLYIKPEGALNPNGHAVHVARYDMAAYIDVNYVRMTGFEVRYYGTTAASSGLTLRGANHCELIGNTTFAIGGKGIYVRVLASDNLIEYNVCRDPRISGWPWDATKAHDEELQGISNRGGRGNVIRYNTVRGTFDGIDSGGDTSTEDIAADTDLHHNTIIGVADDALETESFAGINYRCYRNWVEDPLNCMSIAPNLVGPEYVLYNTFHNFRKGGFKLSISSNGQTWIMHNTIASTKSGTGPVYPTGPYSNKHWRNNIMVGNGQPSIGDDAGESGTGCDFDGDLLNVQNYGNLVVWKGVAYATLATFRSATGFEANGKSGDPKFTSAASGNYTLLTGSPAIDAAIRFPGINDGFMGAAPDMGANEFSNGVDVTPPAAVRDLTSN